MDNRRWLGLLGTMILGGSTLLGAGPRAPGHDRLNALPSAAHATQVWAWGSNNRGQLGNGTIDYWNVPVRVQGLPPDIVSIASGGSHALALDSSGHVWAWGNNDSGQLGVPQHVCRTDYGGARIPCARRPVRLPTLQHVVMIAAAGDDSLALERDGSVWDWGANGYGELGSDPSGLPAIRSTPTRIRHLPPMVAITTSAGVSGAITRNGTVWTWGAQDSNLLATGSDPTGPNGPAPVPGLSGAVALAAGNYFLLALRKDGAVWAWGDNSYAELGIGSKDSAAHRPAPVPRLHDIVAVAAGASESLAVGRDGTLWAWGDLLGGLMAECCTSTASVETRPVRLDALGGAVAAVAAGDLHDAAVTRDGSVWTWFDNNGGDLGLGNSGFGPDLPTLVRRLAHVVAVATGWDSTFALESLPQTS